tara:strand:+ start:328 stop:936 length:609 start_codon:yes stop_codon:yes gene_type:complete
MSIEDYECPVAPKVLECENKNYFCDFCTINRSILNDEEQRCTIETQLASFDGTTNFKKHLETKKHLKQMEELQKQKESGLSKYCKYCKMDFTEEAYRIHHDRNRMFYLLIDKKSNGFVSCNNFVLNNKRFTSWNSISAYKILYQEYQWKKKTYNKYIRLLREGKGKKKLNESTKASILNKFYELDLKKYNNNKNTLKTNNIT